MISAVFDGIEARILHELKDAQYSVLVAMAWLTNKALLTSLINLSENGIDIQVIVNADDEINSRSSILYRQLVDKGGKLYKSGNETWTESGLMHNKFCVIDYTKVITGSFNWTERAEQGNKENIVVLNEKKIAAEYADQFYLVRRSSIPFFNDELNDPQIVFYSNRTVVSKDDEFALFWNAPEGYKITLDGNEVDNVDETYHTIDEDKIYVLKVFNSDNVYTRSVFVECVLEPQINLSISHNYIMHGYETLKLSWSVENASSIYLYPIGKISENGEMIISPEKTMRYFIIASNSRYFRKSEELECVVVPPIVINQIDVPFPKVNLETKIDITGINKPYFEKPFSKFELNLSNSYLDLKRQVYLNYKVEVPKFEIGITEKKSLMNIAKEKLSGLLK